MAPFLIQLRFSLCIVQVAVLVSNLKTLLQTSMYKHVNIIIMLCTSLLTFYVHLCVPACEPQQVCAEVRGQDVELVQELNSDYQS